MRGRGTSRSFFVPSSRSSSRASSTSERPLFMWISPYRKAGTAHPLRGRAVPAGWVKRPDAGSTRDRTVSASKLAPNANAAFVHGEAPRPGLAATSRKPCPIARARRGRAAPGLRRLHGLRRSGRARRGLRRGSCGRFRCYVLFRARSFGALRRLRGRIGRSRVRPLAQADREVEGSPGHGDELAHRDGDLVIEVFVSIAPARRSASR